MDREAKLKLLKELDSKTDWQALIRKQSSSKSADPSKQQKPLRKLTKSEKKMRKLERQQQEVQISMEKKNVETVVYNNPDSVSKKISRARAKQDDSNKSEASQDDEKGVTISLNKARYEIMKFGIQSLRSQELEDAEAALAISLGAKPKKRPAINYKELQLQRKQEREIVKEREASMMKPKLTSVSKKKFQKVSGTKDKKWMRRTQGRKSNNNRQRKV